MEKKVNLEQKIIDLKLKKRELVLAGKNTSDVDEEIKKKNIIIIFEGIIFLYKYRRGYL